MRAIVVEKHTAFFHRCHDSKIQALLERKDEAVERLVPAHQEHMNAVEEFQDALRDTTISVRRWVKGAGVRFDDTTDADIVITLGGDGTVLAASHSVGGNLPILGINSAPNHSIGFLCAAQKGGIHNALRDAMAKRHKPVELNRMQVSLNGVVVSNRILNDALFCDACPAATSRYIVHHGDVVEEHRSSGFWIGTAAGSTAATHSAGGSILDLASMDIQMVTREPYLPVHRDGTNDFEYKLRQCFVQEGSKLVVHSKMADGRLYIDGSHDPVSVGIGDVLTFEKSSAPLSLFMSDV